jgi:WD40 repeat protein
MLGPRSPVFSADGRSLAAAFDGAVGVWDTSALAAPRQWIPLARPGLAVGLSADGRLAYVGTAAPPSITVYDVASGAQLRSASQPGAELELSPDGTVLAVADGADVVLLDAATLTERWRVRHGAPIEDLRFSHDGRALASGADDYTTAVWDVVSGDQLHTFGGHAGAVVGLAFSPGDETLHTAGLDQLVLTWDLTGGQRFLRRLDIAAQIEGHQGWILPSPGAESVAFAGGPDGALRFAHLVSGRTTDPVDAGHGAWGATAWRPDGERFVTTGGDGVVRVWDPATGTLVTERRAADGHIGGIGYTADGASLMIAERAGFVSTIDAETLQPAGPRIAIGGAPVFAFASPTAPTAMVFTYNALVIMVDLASGVVLEEQPLNHGANIGDFSPDGLLFAVPGRDGHVRLLDGATGAPVADRVAHTDQAMLAAFSPDGTTYVTSGFDGRVNLWDSDTGALLASVLPAGPLAGVAGEFAPDGETVRVFSDDGDVFEWDLSVDTWIDTACRIAGRDLDQREWREAFPGRPYRRTCPS